MNKILMIYFSCFLLFPFDFVFLHDTYFLMAFRAETDSAVSFIIPTYVRMPFYNIIYVERREFYYRRDHVE